MYRHEPTLVVPLVAAVVPLVWNATNGPHLPILLLAPFAALSLVLWLALTTYVRGLPRSVRLPWSLLLGALSPALALLLLFPFVCWIPYLNLMLLVLARFWFEQPLLWLCIGTGMGLFAWGCDRFADTLPPPPARHDATA